MSNTKKLQTAAVILAATLTFIFTAVLDLSRFLGLYDFYNAYPIDLIKRVNVLLAAALVWLAGKDSLSREDSRLMKLVFVVICIGEVFFLLAKPAYAIVAFAICQSLLIARHSKGLKLQLKKSAAKQKAVLSVWAIVLAAVILTVSILIYPVQKHQTLGIIAASYWIILSSSLWTALTNYKLTLFPKINARMLAAGMVCFYFCDICVGLDTVLSGGLAWMLANSLIWIFYTPAITLLALSCFKYETGSRYMNKKA